MKGGKGGRKRRSTTSAPARGAAPRGKPVKATGKRPANAPPPKGSRKKPEFGWRSSTEET